jgi:hypothetical protein
MTDMISAYQHGRNAAQNRHVLGCSFDAGEWARVSLIAFA